MEENKISPSIISVFVAIINDGKCRNERCEKFNKKLDDHEIEICYFIPLKDHFQRIVLLWSVLLWLFFPYTIQEPPWGTCQQTLWHAQTPERTGKPLFGNKAFSPLLCVVGVPTKVLLDYMHLILASEFLRRLLAWSSKRQWIPRRVQGWGWCGIAKCEVSTWFQPKVKTHKWTKEMERWRVAEFLSPCELAITKTFFPGDYFCNINFEHDPLILHSSIVFEDMISHLKRQFHST